MGKKKKNKKVQCPVCHGVGWYILRKPLYNLDEDVDCEFCNGKGKVKESKVAML